MKQSAYPHELIGEEIEVISAKNKSLLGLNGMIVDETKFSLVIEKNKKATEKKRLLKEGLTFKILKTGRIVEGTTIKRRSEERIKG
ncbi:ribonuclease P protein subunit [Candidatus Woesearchaeota archaeon]|nr:ribonuclease P protein subunit [Candidatus Woesearchaeota archaeon]